MKDDQKIVLPSGKEIDLEDLTKTSRSRERVEEDENYIPVIIKRTDEAVRHPDDILERAIEEGIEQHERKSLSLFLSALSAGLILGFAAMSVAIASQLYPSSENEMMNRVVMAFFYPLGFIVCIMSGTQLFTEHTATAVYPVLDGKQEVKSLIKVWIIILIGNLVGTLISSFLISMADPVIHAKDGFIDIANHLLAYNEIQVFISAVLAGWLMAQGGWLVLATPPASSQVLCIYIVTFIIGIGGLHHSIAGSAEIFGNLFLAKNPNYLKSAEFLIAAIVGNLVGGSFFVGVLNYSHIKKTQEER